MKEKSSLLVRVRHIDTKPNDMALYYAGKIGRVIELFNFKHSTNSRLVSVRLEDGTRLTLPSRYFELINR